MADTYLSYAHLTSEMSQGRDYRIRQKTGIVELALWLHMAERLKKARRN